MSSDSTHPRQRQQALPQGSPSLRSLTHSLCALMEGRAATVCYFVSHSRLWPRCPANRTTLLKMHVWFPATGASLLPADLLLMSSIVGGRVKYIFPLFWLIFHCKQCNFKWSLPAQLTGSWKLLRVSLTHLAGQRTTWIGVIPHISWIKRSIWRFW